MKIAIVLTMHQSKEIRPNGFALIDRYLKSLKESVDSSWKYTIFLFDNTSEDKFNLDKYADMDIRYTYVEDQTKTGNTGPWNDGALTAYNEGYDKIYRTDLKEEITFKKSRTIEDLSEILEESILEVLKKIVNIFSSNKECNLLGVSVL